MAGDGDAPESLRPDVYSRVEYRRLIAWGPRIEREAPFLKRLLAAAPDASVLDAGCGTGEHVAFFAAAGSRAVGIDQSESMILRARDHEAEGRGRFFLGDAREAARLLGAEPPFGLALCLGNMLPHLHRETQLRELLAALRGQLLPRGLLLIQLLNYRRILDGGVRHLPLNFREGEDGREVVFLRLLRPGPDGTLLFFPTSLELDPESEEPVRVMATRRVPLRPWTAEDLVPLIRTVGFQVSVHGDMQGGGFEPLESSDLVLVATRDEG